LRVEDGDGRFAGIIIGNVRPDYFDVFLRSLATDTAAILLGDGAILARLVANATPGQFPADPGDQVDLRGELMRRWHEETAGTYVGRSPFGGETQAASYSSLKSVAGAVYVGIDLERELAPWRLEARNRIAAGIALTVLAGLLTAVMIAGTLRDEHAAGELRTARDAAEAARKRAEEADLNKSNFLAHAGHELRTPLNAIIGFSEVLATEALGPLGEPRYREYSGYIHDSGQHLLGVVNNILDLAQVSAGRWQLRNDRFAVADVLDEVWRAISPLAAARSVTVERNIASGLPDLITERRVIRQILLNLASNAVKFTMAGGRAMIVAAPATDGGLILRISDTGIGIDPAVIDQVAQPFSNFSHVLARTQAGTGLGLPLCRVFVELLGGTMTIHSRVNEGTTVTVMLPASCLVSVQAETDATAAQIRTAS
jgi:signal transduction histidine kinase